MAHPAGSSSPRHDTSVCWDTEVEQPISTLDVLGRGGSPEGWFDRATDAEVAILRAHGTWDHGEADGGDLAADHPQPWRVVSSDDLEHLIVRVTEQPPGWLRPDCARGDHTRN